MAMDIVKSIVSPIVRCAAGPIWSQLGYIIFHKSNFDKLKTQLDMLEEAKQTLQQRITDAKQNGEKIFISVQNSLMQADVAIAEANNFVNNEDNARVGCLNGPFPNLWTMHQLSRKSIEMAKEISEIITKVKVAIKMDTISSLPRLPVEFPQSARGYEPLHSRTSILNEIMQELRDDKMQVIGVYGMGGVGKSMLIEEVAWQAEHGDFGGVVIKATVTSSPNVKRIQGQLADGLGLTFKEESEEGRARRLWDRIKKEEKILVIMDDIWKKINLKEVGVPFGDQHKGCKLLLTSRNLNLLRKEMGTQTNFRLETLSEPECWNLFEKVAGDVVKEYHLQAMTLQVARACKGLPLLLVTVANALKNEEDPCAWKDALLQLTKYDHDGSHSVANVVVELSYEHLASVSHKSLFLLISSHGQYVHIEALLVFGWGLSLFEDVETLTEARSKLYKLINDLKASSLLLEGEREWVRMHDVIREGASKLASKVQPIFSMQEYTNLKEWPKMNQLRNFKHILLPWCYISVLPEILECPELEILILCSLDNCLKLPADFFSRMIDLKVLDLGGMICTPSLPPSLSLLKKLKALYLYRCNLEDITIVSELTGLEILSLEYSKIEKLPEEIGQLTHLLMLSLDNCTRLRKIPTNLLARLRHLEELHMGNCYIQWEVEGSEHCDNASLGELRQLNHLKSLHLQIHDISTMPRDLHIFGKLEKYKILIGYEWKWSWNHGYSEILKTLRLDLSSTTVTHLDRGIKMLLDGVEDLSLAGVRGATNVVPEFNGEGFAQLKHLLIQNSDEILYIIDSTEWDHPHHSLLNLESLVVQNLINLEKICCGQFPKHIFTQLQVIKVEGCESLKSLFSFSMARNLPKLLQIEISECKLMTNVIVEQGEEEFEDNARINFSKIRSIKLKSLHKLVSFSSKKSTTNIQSESDITKYRDNLSYLVSLFDEKIAMPNLETMKLSSINMVKLWEDSSAPSCFQKLTHLTVESCADLKYLFSSLVGKTLVKLQYLEITNCQMMEHIFVQDEEYLCNLKSEMQPILPNIETLDVRGCPRLKNIIPSSSSGLFQNLDKLWVGDCSGFVNIITSSIARSLVNLRNLWIYDCEMVEEVVAREDDSDGSEIAFMKLEHLQLEKLPILSSFCKENFSFKFPILQNLFVIECPKMETFSNGILSIPKLRKVRLTPHVGGEWRWEGELNATIRKVFDEKDSKMATSSMDHNR